MNALGGLAIMISVPVAFVLGVLGIIFDKKKTLAVITTIIAAIIIFNTL